MKCFACKSISGEKRISPGPIIYKGKYWVVDHAYPTKLSGWLVIVLKKHKEALHELTKEEFKELFILQEKTIKILYEELRSEKEYIACFSEKEHFQHIHFHITPKNKDLDPKFTGSKIFSLINSIKYKESVSKDQIIRLSNTLKDKFNSV